MGGPCDPRGCDQFFGSRFAGHVARRYRKRGLDATARRMVDFLEDRGIVGLTVLEIGGVGEIGIELLKRGAAHASNLELSPAYDEEADRLLQESGVGGGAERRLHDIAADPDGVPPADVVVLHRVVCCYPDYERLLAAAAGHARRRLVFSFPPHNALARLFLGAQNTVFKLMRREFRTFSHPPSAMLAVLKDYGLHETFAHHGVVWQVVGLDR